jgi:hypothetical protein
MTDPRDDGAGTGGEGRDPAFRGADAGARPLAGFTPGTQAAGPAAAPAAPTPVRRSGWGRFFKWWMLLSLLTVVVCIVCVGVGLSHLEAAPMHIVIDGDDGSNVSIIGATDGVKALLALGILFFVLFVMLLVPALVLLLLAVVGGAIAFGLGWALIGIAIALATITFPIWIIALPIWFFARRRRALQSATIAA